MSLSDNDLSTPVSSKVDAHPNEMKQFCEKDGIVMQIPEQREECLSGSESSETPPPSVMYVEREKRTKNRMCPMRSKNRSRDMTKRSDITQSQGNPAEKKSDYYTSLQRNVSDEIRDAHNYDFSGRSKNKIKLRWSRKHQREIDFDKSMLQTWFEHGVDSYATAPRHPKSNDSKDDDAYSGEYKPVQAKAITLSDFMPNLSENLVSVESTKGQSTSGHKTKKVHSGLVSEIEATDLDVPDTQWTRPRQRRCPNGCPPSSEFNNLDCLNWKDNSPRALDHFTINKVRSKISEQVLQQDQSEYMSRKSISENADDKHVQDQLKRIDMQIPMCKHGIYYLIDCFADSFYDESEKRLDLLPRKQLNAFADAVKTLAAVIEDLRSSYADCEFLNCTKEFCRYKRLMFSEYGRKRKKGNNPLLPPVQDLISFENRLEEVKSPRYRLKYLLGPEQELNDMSKCTEHFLSIKYKKALEKLDSKKTKEFSENVDYFMDAVFKSVYFPMMSLPEEDSLRLRESVAMFNDAIWQMQDLDEASAGTKNSPCCGLFRSRKSKCEVSPCVDSDFSLTDETDNENEYSKIYSSKASKPEMRDQATQTTPPQYSQIVKANLEALPIQSSSTVEEGRYLIPRQLSPTVMVESMSRNWYDTTDDEDSDHEIREPTPEEVEAIQSHVYDLVQERVKLLASKVEDAKLLASKAKDAADRSTLVSEDNVVDGSSVSENDETKTETQELDLVPPQTINENIVSGNYSASEKEKEAENILLQ